MATNDFTWHKVTEEEKKEIQKQAKQVLENFSNKLSEIPEKKLKEPLIERPQGTRPENKKTTNKTQKEIETEALKKNAPTFNKKTNSIIAEKGAWTQ